MRTRTLFHLSIFVLLTIIITACDGVSLQQASTKPTVDSNAPRGYMAYQCETDEKIRRTI